MHYNGEAIAYRYKQFPLHSGITMLCVSVDELDIAPLAGDSVLWTNLIANAVKKHGDSLTLGVLKMGNQTFVPEPVAGSMKVIWNTFKSFVSSRPVEGAENWPLDTTTATR